MTVIVPFFKKIHKKFLNKNPDEPFETWYDSQLKKYLPESGALTGESSNEATLEKIPANEASHFESQMKLVFQRNYSKIRHSGKGSFLKGLNDSAGKNPFLKTVVTVLIILVLAVAIHVSMTLVPVELKISVSSHGFLHALSLPSAINKRLFPKSIIQNQFYHRQPEPATLVNEPVVKKSPAADSTTRQTVKKPPVPQYIPKKVLTPATAPALDSFPSSRPFSDTIASRPAVTPNPAPGSNQIEKATGGIPRITTLPASQKKQPPSYPDTVKGLP
jgi:hypothetical protein